MHVTVVICTRNPHPARLERVLAGLLAQDLAPTSWDLLLVDNGSSPPVAAPAWAAPFRARVVTETRPGLFHARLAAIGANTSPLLVFFDDDTVPAPGCLRALVSAFAQDPTLVAAGPRIYPEYAVPPPPWLPEFAWALALRDMGPESLSWALADQTPLPPFTPVGAGLALRASALPAYLAHAKAFESHILARSWIGQGCGGNEDKDLVLTLVRAGGRVGYVAGAELTHLIPAERLTPAYYEKLLPGLGFLWMRTLCAHGLNPRPPISRLGCLVRTARSWLKLRAWRRPAPRLRWLLASGMFRGLAENHRDPFTYPPPRPEGFPSP